jgi:hypothetical protein
MVVVCIGYKQQRAMPGLFGYFRNLTYRKIWIAPIALLPGSLYQQEKIPAML